jgi:hypothetical protein
MVLHQFSLNVKLKKVVMLLLLDNKTSIPTPLKLNFKNKNLMENIQWLKLLVISPLTKVIVEILPPYGVKISSKKIGKLSIMTELSKKDQWSLLPCKPLMVVIPLLLE